MGHMRARVSMGDDSPAPTADPRSRKRYDGAVPYIQTLVSDGVAPDFAQGMQPAEAARQRAVPSGHKTQGSPIKPHVAERLPSMEAPGPPKGKRWLCRAPYTKSLAPMFTPPEGFSSRASSLAGSSANSLGMVEGST